MTASADDENIQSSDELDTQVENGTEVIAETTSHAVRNICVQDEQVRPDRVTSITSNTSESVPSAEEARPPHGGRSGSLTGRKEGRASVD